MKYPKCTINQMKKQKKGVQTKKRTVGNKNKRFVKRNNKWHTTKRKLQSRKDEMAIETCKRTKNI